MNLGDKRTLVALSIGFLFATVIIAISAAGISFLSQASFCISCHEMRIVGEQGWMLSKHYNNEYGVVAGCSDCHVPPEFFPMLWAKASDGIKDVVVHIIGEADPHKMDWIKLGVKARNKIYDSSCRRCHVNLTPQGASIKTILAHREYKRMLDTKRCLDCHTEEFHGRFKEFLPDQQLTRLNGGEK